MNVTPGDDWWINKLLNCRSQLFCRFARARWILDENYSHLQPSSHGLAIKRRNGVGLEHMPSRDLRPPTPPYTCVWHHTQNRRIRTHFSIHPMHLWGIAQIQRNGERSTYFSHISNCLSMVHCGGTKQLQLARSIHPRSET